MDPVKSSTVIYCCVWKDGRLLYTYSGGGNEIDQLAALCLEMIPPHHRWYSHCVGDKTFGYLISDGHVYFAIVNHAIGNGSLQAQLFLYKFRDEFRRFGTRGSSSSTTLTSNTSISMSSFTSPNSVCLEEQLLPVVRRLITSLERVDMDAAGIEWPAENVNGHGHNQDVRGSTKAPLLGKPSKQEKRKMKEDHVIAMTMADIEMEEKMRSTDRRVTIAPGLQQDSNDQPTSAPPLGRDLSNSTRSKSSALQKKWCRQVRVILAVDVAICIVLFIIWLAICRGLECIR